MFEKLDLEKLIGLDSKNDPRFFDWLTSDLDDSDYVILGYPDDEGIKNNGGRLGSHLAPNVIRKYFYKMRPSLLSTFKDVKIYDYGNLKIEKDLIVRHKTATTYLERLLDQGKTIISFGGGHDYAYADGKSFLNFCSDGTKKPLIINFDAHFDVRNLDHGITSGTAFYRLLEEDIFDFIEIGIQEQCNTKPHFEYLKSKGAHVVFLNEITTFGQFDFSKFKTVIESFGIENTTCFLSVDIDAFSNAYAPGCSQSFATGLSPDPYFQMMNYFIENFYIRSLGLYEVSPALDFDDKTSKLAALIAYKFINAKEQFSFSETKI